MTFDNVYRGYVIREKIGIENFVGPSSEMYRVALRSHAARFTKDEALDYIQNGYFCKGKGDFVIEDAT